MVCVDIIFYLTFVLVQTLASFSTHTGEIIIHTHPAHCDPTEYFNVVQLRCLPCSPSLHLVPSSDGLSCSCDDRSKILQWDDGSLPICVPCELNEIPTLDQRDCITCPEENLAASDNSSLCEHFHCPRLSLTLERNATGALLPRIECPVCPNGSQPNSDGTECLPCDAALCCEEGSACPSAADLDWPADSTKNDIESCELVANLCVMVLYDDDYPHSPCLVFRDHKRIPTTLGPSLPWIYYGEGDAPSVLTRRRISVRYELHTKSAMNHLNLTAAVFSPKGKFLNMQTLAGHDLQFCPGAWPDLNRALNFLTNYDLSCNIPAVQLLHGRRTQFLDLYLSYQDGSDSVIHAVPVLIRNMPPAPFTNSLSDRSQWQLVRRWFMVDATTTRSVVRYASSITLHIRLQGRSEEGKIFVPYLSIDYSELNEEQLLYNVSMPARFRVLYEMENNFAHAIEISMGVLSALAVICAGIRTWSYSKRSGRLGIDLYTLAYLVLFSCGYLANVFFFVVFCASVDVFVFFKGQSVIHVLLPSNAQDRQIQIYVYAAFALKVVEVAHLIYRQVTVDIFLVDWERPRARPYVASSDPEGDEQPVSIWRTYFVANEWNEIQTLRKVNLSLHLIITVTILKVIGVEHWASAEPHVHVYPRQHVGIGDNATCRFAVGGLVYLSVYFTLWLVTVAMYERYIKNGIQGFVDMCSMANVSIFILALENYGFYIHGRSAHGFADTDMLAIVQQLRREEEDLVGHRGLLPGSDQQTFEMTVPTALRAYYTKVMAPLNAMSRSVRRSGRSNTEKESVDRSVQAYHNMNRFLGAFLDHALKDLDYEVREKLFAESLLDIEFTSTSQKGVLYSDNGHSFDQVLFYGNEVTLLTFDLIVFSFVEIISKDFLLAGAVTGVVAYAISELRCLGGRRNLAKKTLTDERFLI